MSYLPSHTQQKQGPTPETIVFGRSSFLAVGTYDAQNYSLTLDFKNGTQVVHRFVYPIVWQQLKEAPSHGSFYARSIKKQYPSVNFRQPLKVSDLKRAIKEHRPHAPN